MSAGGPVRWDDRGNHVRSLHPPEPYHHVAAVNTVNVSSDSSVLAVYRPGAALAETGPGGNLRVRALPVSNPSGVAIRGDRLLLLGGDERGAGTLTRRDAVRHVHLTDDGAVVTGREDLVLPNGDPVRRHARPVCRGP
ncbi:hypothetical protein [Streptomyces sp. NPDC041003]|uniref:hypothetical protein n=1 Tax=Streptomyces sp. NPDC041003 TaxID=3155730 RepID=UPI0033CCE9FF